MLNYLSTCSILLNLICVFLPLFLTRRKYNGKYLKTSYRIEIVGVILCFIALILQIFFIKQSTSLPFLLIILIILESINAITDRKQCERLKDEEVKK